LARSRGLRTRLPVRFGLRGRGGRRRDTPQRIELVQDERAIHVLLEAAHRDPVSPADPARERRTGKERERDERLRLHPGERTLAVGRAQRGCLRAGALETDERSHLAR
jgi:hypothetical protein